MGIKGLSDSACIKSPVWKGDFYLKLLFVCVFFKVPKLSDGQQNSENQKALPDVAGPKKQVSYKTEIIGGVPIVTQTQVNFLCMWNPPRRAHIIKKTPAGKHNSGKLMQSSK